MFRRGNQRGAALLGAARACGCVRFWKCTHWTWWKTSNVTERQKTWTCKCRFRFVVPVRRRKPREHRQVMKLLSSSHCLHEHAHTPHKPWLGGHPRKIENGDVQFRCYKIHYRQPKFYNRLGTRKQNRMCRAQSILKIDQKRWLCTFLFSVNTNCLTFPV